MMIDAELQELMGSAEGCMQLTKKIIFDSDARRCLAALQAF